MPANAKHSAAFTLSELPAVSSVNRAAFTLLELMISVAIVLMLMLGINFVFSTSAKTVSTGMAFSAVGRDIRGARKTFEQDFGAAVSADEMPALIIHSEEIYAFRDKQDRLADLDYNPNDPVAANRIHQTATYDVDGDASNGDEIDLTAAGAAGYPGNYNHRRHRIDRLSFFVRNQTSDYARQTGDQNTFVSPETSPEAWLCYGMLRLSTNNETQFAKPGVGTDQTNPNNFYASQWMFGRRLTLLKPPPYSNASATSFTGAASPALNLASQATAPQPPRETTANGGPYTAGGAWLMPESRVDMADATIATIRADAALAGNFYRDAEPAASNIDICDYTAYAARSRNSLNYLFWAKPFVNKSAFTGGNALAAQAREMALTSTIFLRGCTQFIVEFAGDFYDQGAVGGGPEVAGTIDYNWDNATGATQIRWYGLPRDVDGGQNANGRADVNVIVPQPPAQPRPLTWSIGGINTPRWTGGGNFPNEHAGLAGTPTVWAWGPTVPAPPGAPNNIRPKLIRITLELIDANGRLPDGQRIEFVYALK